MQDEHSFDLMTFSDHFSCVHAATMFLGLAQQNQIRKTIFGTQPQWMEMNSELRKLYTDLKMSMCALLLVTTKYTDRQ